MARRGVSSSGRGERSPTRGSLNDQLGGDGRHFGLGDLELDRLGHTLEIELHAKQTAPLVPDVPSIFDDRRGDFLDTEDELDARAYAQGGGGALLGSSLGHALSMSPGPHADNDGQVCCNSRVEAPRKAAAHAAPRSYRRKP